MERVLAILGTTDIGTFYIAEAVRAFGFSPVFLANLGSYSGDTRRALIELACIPLTLNSPEEVATLLLEKYRKDQIVGVISFSDLNIINSIEAAKILNVSTLDESNIFLKDKSSVADICRKFSPASLYLKFGDFLLTEKLEEFFLENEVIILKPTHGAGGEGISKIANTVELQKFLNSSQFRESECNWIAQRFLRGSVFSAEGFVEDGKIEIIGFTGRKRVRGTETGAFFPYALKYGSNFVIETISHLVKESKFSNGYFHIEFLEEDDSESLYLIDANMGRLGGGPIVDLLAFSYGVNAGDIYKHVISISLRNSLDLGFSSPFRNKAPRDSMALLYGLKDGGWIDRVELPSEFSPTAKDMFEGIRHVQLLSKNDFAKPIGTDDWAWIGIASGLRKDTQEFVDRIKIFSDGKGFSPYY